METKNNFTGIIIPVVIAVILLTVLPILVNMTPDCPPCEQIPSYNVGNIEVNPNFSSGNYIVDKGSYDYLDNVTIIKDDNLIPENIKKDVNIFGVVGTLESGGGGSGITVTITKDEDYHLNYGVLSISFDNGSRWIDLNTRYGDIFPIIFSNVSQIKLKLTLDDFGRGMVTDVTNNVILTGEMLYGETWTSDNIIISENTTYSVFINTD